MLLKAFVKRKGTKEFLFVESDYDTKQHFVFDLRRNGYAVDPTQILLADQFNWILENTDCSPLDYMTIRKFGKTLPKDYSEYSDMKDIVMGIS